MVRRGRKRPANKNETARIPCPEGAEGSGAIEQVQPGVVKGDGEVTIQAVRQGDGAAERDRRTNRLRRAPH